MRRLVEALAPARLGSPFRWLIASSWVSNLGDGLAIAAAPLLIASETHDPLLVALGALLQRLPWLLFGLYAGVLADRLDRRALIVSVALMRAAVVALLTVTIVTGRVNVIAVLAAMLLVGIAEVFADTSTGTLLPMVIAKQDLGIGNARLMTSVLMTNQLAGPAVGAALFAAGRAWPFLVQAVCVAFGAVLISRMRLPGSRHRSSEPSHLRREVAEGLRWTWGNAAVRTLTLTIVTFNVTWGAAWSVLVLYAIQRLGLGAFGYGMLNTLGALGGLAGIASYDWLERRASLAHIMRVGLLIETFTHLGLAVTTTPWIAMAIMFIFGAHALIWGTTSRTVRMRAVPMELQGRVGGMYSLALFGGIFVGQVLGGVIARIWGVTGPFWFAFAGSALLLSLIWRELGHIAHADERGTAEIKTAA